MVTTIKISEETKKRLLTLDLAGKGKTFDMVVNDLITYYVQVRKNYSKDHKKYDLAIKSWEKSQHKYAQDLHAYEQKEQVHKKEKQIREKLLKWAKSQGFKE